MKHSCKGLITSTVVITTLTGCSGEGGSAKVGISVGGMAGSTAGQTTGSQQTGGTTSPVGGSSTNGGASTNGGMSTKADTSSGGLSVTTGGTVSQSGGTAGQTTITTGGSSNQSGGATNQAGTSSCIAPDCCVPTTLNPSRVDVYQVSGSIIVNLVVEPSVPANLSSFWLPYAEITTSWGGTQTCNAERRVGIGARFVTLRCPATALSTPFTCGSPVSVQVRLRTDSYAETDPYGLVCVGSNNGPWTTITVPVKCPTCPSSANFFGHQLCDYPDPPSGTSIPQCSYFLPCPCMVNESTGIKLWLCPQP